ncbi:hypothetical protein IX51_08915 [uncultured archaeon]|nr:hypothetical protein IX51_08915 [uncultured archaeon]HKJ96802.1 hypothetical protein [Thermoplasmataceae archaeon]
MANVPISLAMADYDRTKALIEGFHKPVGIDLTYVVSPPSETFWRMLRFAEFEASEMSLSTFLISKSQGRKWKAIPVFPFRGFFHTNIFVSRKSSVKEPEDLKGKKFGVPEYQVTAAVWLRGALEEDFGVAPQDMTWYVERKKGLSHGGETSFKPPEGVKIEQVPEGETLDSMIRSGKLDAIMPSPYPGMKSLLNKTDYLELSKSDEVRLLFDDPVEEGRRFFKKHGYSHINHTVIVRDDVVEKYPWVPLNLYKAFEESKIISNQKLDKMIKSSLVFGFPYLMKEREIFGGDAFPYGMDRNRKALEELVQMSVNQGLTSKPLDLDSLFYEDTLNA